MNGQISFYDGEKFTKIRPPYEYPSSITSIKQDSSGILWAGSNSSGLVKIDDLLQTTVFNTKNRDLTVVDFAFLTPDKVLIGNLEGLFLYRIGDNNELFPVTAVDEIPDGKIQEIQKRKNNKGFFVSTENQGIYILDLSKDSIRCFSITRELAPDLEFVQHTLEDRAGNLWIGTFAHGIVKLIKDENEQYSRVESIRESDKNLTDIKYIFEDREGNIWVSNFGLGFSMVVQKKFNFISSEDIGFGEEVRAITQDNHSVWFGSEQGIARIDAGEEYFTNEFSGEKIIGNYSVTSMFNTNKWLWIGTEEQGLYKLNKKNNSISPYFLHDGYLENSINTITGTDSVLWIGTRKGLCRINIHTSDKKWYNIQSGDLPHNCVNHLFLDHMKRLWIATTSNVLCYYDESGFKRIPIFSQEGIKSIEGVGQDLSGDIWISTNGSGVFKIMKDSAVNITSGEGLLSDYCYSVFGDEQGFVWVGHRKGLSRIRTSDLFVRKFIEELDAETEMNFQYNAFLQKQNAVFFGADKGVVTYAVPIVQVPEKEPALSIKAVYVNDVTTVFNKEIILSPGEYKIEIKFIGIHFTDPEAVKYQYILEGYQDDWSLPTSERSVIYKALSEGKYTFKVEAASYQGLMSSDYQSLRIIIRKPFWKQLWFYLLAPIMLIMLVFGYIKRREYQLIEEKKTLEKNVSERTAEVLKQKEEIEQQKNLINEKNKNITASINYAQKIQSAVLSPKSMLNDWFQDSCVGFLPRDIVSGDFYWFNKFRDRIILALADCTGHGVPGSFMSMLGMTLLNEIAGNETDTTPDIILNRLRIGVMLALHQDENDLATSDGLDISLCVINTKTGRFQYSGAFNPLFLIRDQKVELIEGDKMHVSFSHLIDKPFTYKEFKIKRGDIFYMFTDGYEDQFGGPRDRKYSRRKLCELLNSISQKSMKEQKDIIFSNIRDWMKDTFQVDDISFIGIKY